MSIKDSCIDNLKFNIKTNPDDKFKYGEIYTSRSLVEDILNMLPQSAFSNPDARWLDPGAGTGHFSIVLYHKLFSTLRKIFDEDDVCHNHIITNMLFMIEIKTSNVERLREIFGEKANIINEDFLLTETDILFDYIVGNPPYNADGIKKVPTNSIHQKKNDGRTIWIPFVKQAVSLLKPDGYLAFIIPSIWMKPDKAKMYHYLTSYKLEKIRCLTNTETNRLFGGEAQTPTSCLLLKKQSSNYRVNLYDKNRELYIHYRIRKNYPLPIFGAMIIKKLMPHVIKAGPLKVHKTNLPSPSVTISSFPILGCPYKNIKTCLLESLQPKLIINYSSKSLPYNNKPKLVLAHKMYGFPYLDEEGTFGISNRDNYVIIERSISELRKLQAFLGTKTALYIFEATRYRMKYLEKYAFNFIPDIINLSNFPEIITEESIALFFNFDDIDRENINNLHRKNYKFIPELNS